MKWEKATDITKQVKRIVKTIELKHIDPKRIICFRSIGSTSRAHARIWAFPKVWQQALDVPAHYVLEVLSEKFDHLKDDDKTRVLIHELLHIPRNFSGSLRPHKARKWRLNRRLVEMYFKEYKKKK